MVAHKRIWLAIGLVVSAMPGADLFHKGWTKQSPTFHVIGHLELPAVKAPNYFRSLHVSETSGKRMVTVIDANNMMAVVDCSDRGNPVLKRQVQLPVAISKATQVTLMGGVALVMEESEDTKPVARTLDILDMNSHKTPEIASRFQNVTAWEIDPDLLHFYLISGNDLWILGGTQDWNESPFAR
jgi:hypothetical protein